MRMRTAIPLILTLLAGPAAAEVAVIVHPENEVDGLSKAQFARVFLGRAQTFPDGSSASPLNQGEDSAVRQEFEEAFLGRTPSQMKAYWAKAMFSGSATPPPELDGDAAVKAAVAADPSAIGYVDAASVDGSVKVIPIR